MTEKKNNTGESAAPGAGKSVLIVGAGGFVGGFLARRALELGYDTYVGVRVTTSRRYLDMHGLHFVVMDYDSDEAIVAELRANAPGPQGWTYIVWNLGATKARRPEDFYRVNFQYQQRFVNALRTCGYIPQKFVYMSSLSVLGPGDERNYTPFTMSSEPAPNTDYGRSKLMAERSLEQQPDVPWIILRPTGIYGPHERDYLMMIQSIDRHLDASVGFRRQQLTFLYVDDLVQAVYRCLEAPSDKVVHHKYILSDGGSYTQAEFRALVLQSLRDVRREKGLPGKTWAVPVCFPLWAVYMVSAVSQSIAVARGTTSTLNRDKFKIMRQRNWNCDISDAVRDFGYSPAWPLPAGVNATVRAYLSGAD